MMRLLKPDHVTMSATNRKVGCFVETIAFPNVAYCCLNLLLGRHAFTFWLAHDRRRPA